MEKENLWWHRRTDQKGEYSAICLFEGWKIEHRNLGTIRLVSEEKSLSSVIYAKDPHLVADIFKVCSILTPPHPISRGKVACIKASMDQTSRQSFIPFCLSLQNCWLCPSGLSAPPEEFLLALLALWSPPGLASAQWEPFRGFNKFWKPNSRLAPFLAKLILIVPPYLKREFLVKKLKIVHICFKYIVFFFNF